MRIDIANKFGTDCFVGLETFVKGDELTSVQGLTNEFKERHTSLPFGSSFISFRVRAPVLLWQEIAIVVPSVYSITDCGGEFFIPDVLKPFDEEKQVGFDELKAISKLRAVYKFAMSNFERLIEEGLLLSDALLCLPMGAVCEFVAPFILRDFIFFLEKFDGCSSDTCQRFIDAMKEIAENLPEMTIYQEWQKRNFRQTKRILDEFGFPETDVEAAGKIREILLSD